MKSEKRKLLKTRLVRTVLLIFWGVGIAVALVVGGISLKASKRHLSETEDQLKQMISLKGRGLAANHATALRNLVADNAFSDVTHLVEKTVLEDVEVVFGTFVAADGNAWVYSRRDSGGQIAATTKDEWKELGIDVKAFCGPGQPTQRARSLFSQDLFEFCAQVANVDDGVLGHVIYGLSGQRLSDAIVAAKKDASRDLMSIMALLAAVCLIALVLTTALVRRVADKITSPLSVLATAAGKLAQGQRGATVNITSDDEIADLGDAFNSMSTALATSHASLQDMNRSLEQRVHDRTSALRVRNEDMRLVLANVRQGLVTVCRAGIVATERSAILETWFGTPPAGATFPEYISPHDKDFGKWFALGLEQLDEDWMPVELILEQMPKRIYAKGSTFDTRYIPLLNESNTLLGLLLVIEDITASEALARKDAEQRELMRLFEGANADRSGFIAAFSEVDKLVAQLETLSESSDRQEALRWIHTLKGNSGFMGFEVVSSLCHNIEGGVAASDELPTQEQLAPLLERWRRLREKAHELLGESATGIEVSQAELQALKDSLTRLGQPELVAAIDSWTYEPIGKVFRRFATQAQQLSTKLGKGCLDIEIDDGGIRLDPRVWSELWSQYVHLVRNAVDHGLQTPEARAAADKQQPPKLTFRAFVDAHRLVIECSDNGAGVDWDTVRAKASYSDLPAVTYQDLLNALTAPGFSTKGTVTDVSGRGVGMSAVLNVVRTMGGEIDVKSVRGQGCTWIISLPAHALFVSKASGVQTPVPVKRSA